MLGLTEQPLYTTHTSSATQAGINSRMATTTPLRTFTLPNAVRLGIGVGDITKFQAAAIVNAANERMLGGGGVDGAIHRAAGRGLYEACLAVPEIRRGVRCPTGEARITPGFELSAPFVIHTVGPIYESDHESQPLLQMAHRSCLELAGREGLASIAFPALSCGVYGYPIAKAARVAVQTCVDFSSEQGNTTSLKSIDFVLFSPDIYKQWVEAAEDLAPAAPQEEQEQEDAAGEDADGTCAAAESEALNGEGKESKG